MRQILINLYNTKRIYFIASFTPVFAVRALSVLDDIKQLKLSTTVLQKFSFHRLNDILSNCLSINITTELDIIKSRSYLLKHTQISAD